MLGVSGLLGSAHRSGRGDRRVRRFTTRWTRFDGPCGNEDGCWPSSRRTRKAYCLTRARTLAPFTTSSLTSRHPARSRFRLRRTACVGSNRIEIASTEPREGNGVARSETPSSDPSPLCRAERLPESVLRRRSGCPPLASRTRAPFGIRTAGDDCNRSLQPTYDARARRRARNPLPRLAVARFAFRRWRTTAWRATPICGDVRNAARATFCPLTCKVHVSGSRRLSLSLRARGTPARACRVGDEPRMRCVRRRSSPLRHDVPSCDDPSRHHGERRGPRPASSRL